MSPKKQRSAVKVVVIDDSNSVFDRVRGPASEVMRKIIRDKREKEKKLLELREKYHAKTKEGHNGEQTDGNVTRVD